MLNTIQKNIIIRALCIRKDAGEDPKNIIGNYHKLSSEEKMEILDEIGVKEIKIMINCNTFTPPPKLSEYLVNMQYLQLDWRCK